MERSTRHIVVIIFLCMLFAPLLLKFLGVNPSAENFENKGLKTIPTLNLTTKPSEKSVFNKGKETYQSLVKYKDEFNDYFQDNFEFKNQFFNIYSTVEGKTFGTNPLPSKVVQGDDGWYFLGDSHGSIIQESTGLLNFSNQRIARMTDSIGHRASWASEREMKYYLAVAPNKQTIYGEKLNIRPSKAPTKFDQLLEAGKLINLPIIDLGADFHTHPEEQLYYKTDSHWNDLGAYLGYQSCGKMLQKDFPQLTLIDLNQFNRVTDSSYVGDLIKMLQINRPEAQIKLTLAEGEDAIPLESIYEIPDTYKGKKNQYEIRYQAQGNDLKILIFRDSFFTALEPYFKESFGNTVLIWSSKFDKNLIEREKPDIVIQQVAERNLDYLLN